MPILEKYKNPKYTGDNRCIYCTLVNISLSALLTGTLLALGTALGKGTLTVILGTSFLGLSFLAIFFRGYFIPGTPTYVKRLVPYLTYVRDMFHHLMTTQYPNFELEKELVQMGILHNSGDNLSLNPRFKEEWLEEISCSVSTKDIDRDMVSCLLGIPKEAINIKPGRGAKLYFENQDIGVAWPSETSMISDITSARIIKYNHLDWEHTRPFKRFLFLKSIRLFLDSCPICQEELESKIEQFETCCSSAENLTLTCPKCGDLLLQTELN